MMSDTQFDLVCSCKISFKEFDTYESHMKICHQHFENVNEEKEHYITKHSVKKFKCSQCSKSLSSKGHLKTHVEAVHMSKKCFTCEHCHHKFSQKCNLTSHILSIHDKVKKFICPEPNCNLSFSRKCHMLSHFKKLHRLTSEKSTENCKLCSQTFQSVNDSIIHMKECHNISKIFPCPECTASFHRRGHLKTHIKNKHLNDRPFECEYCHLWFKRSPHLKTHLQKIHNISNVFVCSKCCISFGRNEDLQSHIQNEHTIDRPFKCKYCDFRFKRNKNLKQHLLNIHNSSDLYSCSHCEFSCSLKSILKTHFNTRHLELISEMNDKLMENASTDFQSSPLDNDQHNVQFLNKLKIPLKSENIETNVRIKSVYSKVNSSKFGNNMIVKRELSVNKYSHFDEIANKNSDDDIQASVNGVITKEFSSNEDLSKDLTFIDETIPHKVQSNLPTNAKLSPDQLIINCKNEYYNNNSCLNQLFTQEDKKVNLTNKINCQDRKNVSKFNKELKKENDHIIEGLNAPCKVLSNEKNITCLHIPVMNITEKNLLEEGVITCPQCNEYFISQYCMDSHINLCHQVIYECTHCKFTSSEKSSILQHEISSHMKILFNCKECEFTSSSESYVKEHINIMHAFK